MKNSTKKYDRKFNGRKTRRRRYGGDLTPPTEDVIEVNYEDAEGDIVSLLPHSNKNAGVLQYHLEKKIINDYYEMDILGKGGFGTVYRSRRMDDPEKYAVKVIDISGQLHIDAKIEAIEIEVDILRILSAHCKEYFVCFKDYMQEPDTLRFFIVCEELEGYISLYDFAKSREFRSSLTELSIPYVNIVENLCNGLHQLHELGIAHRDLKPQNVLVHPETHAIKYIDFGLSCNGLSKKLTKTCFGKSGTPNYLDPLLFSKKNVKIFASDLWSLGMMFFFMLSLKFPYSFVKNKDDKMDKELIAKYNMMPETWQTAGVKKIFQKNDMHFHYARVHGKSTARIEKLLSLDWKERYILVNGVLYFSQKSEKNIAEIILQKQKEDREKLIRETLWDLSSDSDVDDKN